MTHLGRAGLSISESLSTDSGKTRPYFPNLFHLCQMLSQIGINPPILGDFEIRFTYSATPIVEPKVYQLKVVLKGITRMIWRRILVHSHSTIIMFLGRGITAFLPKIENKEQPAI
jgi:hypothetical protein